MKRFFIIFTACLIVLLPACNGDSYENDESYESGYDHGYYHGYEDGYNEGKEEVYDDINQHNEELYTYRITPLDAYNILYEYVENGTPISKDDADSIMCLIEEMPYSIP